MQPSGDKISEDSPLIISDVFSLDNPLFLILQKGM